MSAEQTFTSIQRSGIDYHCACGFSIKVKAYDIPMLSQWLTFLGTEHQGKGHGSVTAAEAVKARRKARRKAERS